MRFSNRALSNLEQTIYFALDRVRVPILPLTGSATFFSFLGAAPLGLPPFFFSLVVIPLVLACFSEALAPLVFCFLVFAFGFSASPSAPRFSPALDSSFSSPCPCSSSFSLLFTPSSCSLLEPFVVFLDPPPSASLSSSLARFTTSLPLRLLAPLVYIDAIRSSRYLSSEQDHR